jgi:hypothetical protein
MVSVGDSKVASDPQTGKNDNKCMNLRKIYFSKIVSPLHGGSDLLARGSLLHSDSILKLKEYYHRVLY